MLWRDPASDTPDLASGNEDEEPSSILRRALQRKERRIQQRAAAAGTAGSSAHAPAAPPELIPATAPVDNEEVQQLLLRANSLLSTVPGIPTDDLRQRVAELGPIPQVLQALGPIPEVLQALQDLLRNESNADPDLPQYSEGSGSRRAQ
jgi:hypothetical protein